MATKQQISKRGYHQNIRADVSYLCGPNHGGSFIQPFPEVGSLQWCYRCQEFSEAIFVTAER